MKYLIESLKLLFWLAVCQLPGLAGTNIVSPNLEWYHSLVMPPFMPPDAVFGMMWGLLYILLGISAFLIFRKGLSHHRKPIILFIIQLALNAWWTPVFFGSHNPGAAFIILLAMLGQGVWLARAFWQKNRAAAWLLLPYGIWLVYAGYLNAAIWLLNA